MGYWSPRKMTPAEKRYENRVSNNAWAVLEKLAALPPNEIAAVPPLFKEVGKTTDERYEVFRRLDESGGYFGYEKYGTALSLLRKTRNSPEYGPKLFAVINGEA